MFENREADNAPVEAKTPTADDKRVPASDNNANTNIIFFKINIAFFYKIVNICNNLLLSSKVFQKSTVNTTK